MQNLDNMGFLDFHRCTLTEDFALAVELHGSVCSGRMVAKTNYGGSFEEENT